MWPFSKRLICHPNNFIDSGSEGGVFNIMSIEQFLC